MNKQSANVAGKHRLLCLKAQKSDIKGEIAAPAKAPKLPTNKPKEI